MTFSLGLVITFPSSEWADYTVSWQVPGAGHALVVELVPIALLQNIRYFNKYSQL